ncbi:hypothetical protein [Alienimonas chondri]|uniref:Uncharacterized protein n=1 Tax=Alienimonas chondri TaxID=2681879 RepID=A0ABX1VC83_9PLAN|nr:hypothetical protein [Alienimonas chondri]NNJ25664.1 hypothetical protein [Alienimonas chondri]
MIRSTLTAAATAAALFAVGQTPADAGDRPRVSMQLSVGNGYGSTYGGGYGGGRSSGYQNFSRFDSYGGGLSGNRFGSGLNRGRGLGSDYGYSSRYGNTYGHSGYGSRVRTFGGGHGAGHYDYHAPTVVPHGNHLDVTPGHYDFHRSHR